MTMQRKVTRRNFLAAATAASAAVVAAPYYVPKSAFGANDKVITGHIGVRNQGMGNLNGFMNNAGAICDVDSEVLAKALKQAENKGRKCDGYGDYRKLLDRKDIDAVVISTPDHWHALMTIDACKAGKDVYCEKPLSLTVAEGRAMVKAARDNKRIVQTGSQQRSDSKFRQACELVRSGRIGKLQTVLVGIPGPNYPKKKVADSDPPTNLDYDLWLGPAPQRPYNELRVHYNFRFYWDYSGGQMTNFGAHHIDIAHWGMGMDDSGPLEVGGEATFNKEGFHEVTETVRLSYKYPNDVTMIVGQGQKDIKSGATFIGDKGTIYVTRGKIESTPTEILDEKLKDSDVHLYVSGSHHKNFLECIASRKLPICDVEIGHRSATACHLGNLAARLKRTIKWDAAKEQVVGDDEANGMLSRPYRGPWKIS